MYPILLQLGPFAISSLWAVSSIGFFIGINYFLLLTKRLRFSLKPMMDHFILLSLGSIFGARLFGFVENYFFYSSASQLVAISDIFYIWDKQFNLIGGLITFISMFIVLLHIKEEKILSWLDILTQPILIILFFHAIGSFLDGQMHGKETNLPWGIILDNTNVKYLVPIHPTQLYEAFYVVLLFIFNQYGQSSPLNFYAKEGNLSFFTMSAYSFMKFIEIFFRGDDTTMFYSVRLDQAFSLFIAMIGVYGLYKLHSISLKKIEEESVGILESRIQKSKFKIQN